MSISEKYMIIMFIPEFVTSVHLILIFNYFTLFPRQMHRLGLQDIVPTFLRKIGKPAEARMH